MDVRGFSGFTFLPVWGKRVPRSDLVTILHDTAISWYYLLASCYTQNATNMDTFLIQHLVIMKTDTNHMTVNETQLWHGSHRVTDACVSGEMRMTAKHTTSLRCRLNTVFYVLSLHTSHCDLRQGFTTVYFLTCPYSAVLWQSSGGNLLRPSTEGPFIWTRNHISFSAISARCIHVTVQKLGFCNERWLYHEVSGCYGKEPIWSISEEDAKPEILGPQTTPNPCELSWYELAQHSSICHPDLRNNHLSTPTTKHKITLQPTKYLGSHNRSVPIFPASKFLASSHRRPVKVTRED